MMAQVCLVLVGSKKILWMAWWSPGLLNHKQILISYISQLASQELIMLTPLSLGPPTLTSINEGGGGTIRWLCTKVKIKWSSRC